MLHLSRLTSQISSRGISLWCKLCPQQAMAARFVATEGWQVRSPHTFGAAWQLVVMRFISAIRSAGKL